MMKNNTVDFNYIDSYDSDNDNCDNNTIKCQYSNPFYLSSIRPSICFTKNIDIMEEYKYVYLLCLNDKLKITEKNEQSVFNKINKFHDPNTTLKQLKKIEKYVVLVQGPIHLINQKRIRTGLRIISNIVLDIFNKNNYMLNKEELVYLMLETKESIIRKAWLDIYENNNLDLFIEKKIFQSYYGINDLALGTDLINEINKFSDTLYWQDIKNCELSRNKKFLDRKFNLQINKNNLPIEEIENEVKKIILNFKDKQTRNVTYPNQLTDNNEIHENIIEKTSYYELVDVSTLNLKETDIEELLTSYSLNEQQKYYLLCNLLASKKYCHLILKNVKIMTESKYLFDKYEPIFRYILGYAWSTMYIEESIKYTKIEETDRFVFTLDTANLLPIHPIDKKNPKINPYFTLFCSDENVNYESNIGCVLPELNNRIVNLDEFRRRMNIFISENQNINILENVNWTNMVVTGSIMAAILPQNNKLLELYTKKVDRTISQAHLIRFFKEYYSNSDIDIACNHENNIDFIEHILDTRKIIADNMKINEKNIKIETLKSLAIYIDSNVLKKKCDKNEVPYAFDFIMANKNNHIIKFYFYNIYLENKKKTNINNISSLGSKINNPYFFELVTYCQFINTTLTINNYVINSDEELDSELVFYEKYNNDNYIKFSESLKFKLHSESFKHSFEFFRIKNRQFFSSISRFHLPCVRSYYNGTNCYMLPSAITAYLTFTNIDFKYFVGSSDPISIIDKYRKRGFGTILNQFEIRQYLAYISVVGNNKQAYNINNDNIKSILGYLPPNHDFYKPRKYIPKEFIFDPTIKNKYKKIKARSIIECESHYRYKFKSYPFDLTKITTIDTNGSITPLKKWMIDIGFDTLQSSNKLESLQIPWHIN